MAFASLTNEMLSEGRLVSPEIMLNYMERDWEAFAIPFELSFVEQTFGVGTHDLIMTFPESWGLDTTFDSDMELRLVVYVEFKKTGGAGWVTVGFTNSSVTDTGEILDTSYAWFKLERKWTGTLPTGVTTVELNITHQSTGTSAIRRLLGRGPDCYLYFNI